MRRRAYRPLHACSVDGCEAKTSARYCRSHMAALRAQTAVPAGMPTLRDIRKANQERLRLLHELPRVD